MVSVDISSDGDEENPEATRKTLVVHNRGRGGSKKNASSKAVSNAGSGANFLNGSPTQEDVAAATPTTDQDEKDARSRQVAVEGTNERRSCFCVIL